MFLSLAGWLNFYLRGCLLRLDFSPPVRLIFMKQIVGLNFKVFGPISTLKDISV